MLENVTHLKMNPSHSHFFLVLKNSVISVQISQLIRDFNFQLCTFILKLSKVNKLSSQSPSFNPSLFKYLSFSK